MRPVLPASDSAPKTLKDLRFPNGCGPFAAWAILEAFGLSPSPDEILAACRFRREQGTYMLDIAAALAGFGLQVEYSSDQEPGIASALEQEYEEAARQRARDARVTFKMAYTLRELGSLLDGGSLAVIIYNTERTRVHPHITPLTAIENEHAIMPFDHPHHSPLALDILEWCRGYHGIQRECLVISRPDAIPSPQ